MTEEREEILTDPVKQIICAKCGKPLDVTGLAAFSKFRCGHCHAVQTVPARLGNFILLELLGRGGMGAVYRAVDQALGRPVALKVMLRSMADDRVFYEQFKREARAAAALNHPNIVQVFALDEEKGQSYIVMELLSGGRLDQLIAKKKRLDEAEMLRIGLEVAEGLKAAHGAGLIHDDIKPENILFDTKGVAKVVDFGLARFRGKGPHAAQNEIWGTPYYIAPEKVLRQPPDFHSDIYSLGGTLFHALTGRPPFEGETAMDVVKARVQETAPDVRSFRPDVRPGVAALLARMLEREPAKRHKSYDELIDEFRQLAGIEAPKGAGTGEPGQKSTKILIKGKKKLILSSPEGGASDAGAEEAKPARKKRSAAKPILLTLLILAVLGGIGWGVYAWMQSRSATQAAAKREEAFTLDRQTATDLLGRIRAATTGVLAGAEAFFFNEVEATNQLAAARAILDAMGENAKLVTLPTLPQEGELVAQVEPSVLRGFGILTNLEALVEEASTLQAAVEKGKPGDPAVKKGVSRLRAILEEIEPLAGGLASAQAEAARIVPAAADLVKRAEEIRLEGEKRAAAAAAENEAKRKAEAEAAAKRKAEQERLARIAAEREKVAALWTGNEEALKQNRYAEVAERIKNDTAGLETPEGKADAAAALEKLALLQEMKDHLIASIRAKPMKWGWLTPGGQIDISGANEEGIVVRGRTEPWSGVSANQMVRLLDHYVKLDEFKGGRDYRAWARLKLAAALYCFMQGRFANVPQAATDYASKLARGYADLAAGEDLRLEPEIKRLMPDLPAVMP